MAQKGINWDWLMQGLRGQDKDFAPFFFSEMEVMGAFEQRTDLISLKLSKAYLACLWQGGCWREGGGQQADL